MNGLFIPPTLGYNTVGKFTLNYDRLVETAEKGRPCKAGPKNDVSGFQKINE